MRLGKYQEVTVTLSSATFFRLERANPFNKRRVAEQAIAAIVVAINTMYPPRTPEDWKDRSRFQGVWRHALLYLYDFVSYLLRRLMGGEDDLLRYTDHMSNEPAQIILKIPIGLMSWIEKMARSNQSTIPEATVYAIEYGLRVLDSQGGSEDGAERLRKVWSDIFHAIRQRLFKVGRT